MEDFETTYETTLLVITFIGVVYVIQSRTHMTLADVYVSRQQIFEQKRFHRIVLALISHPPPLDSLGFVDRENDHRAAAAGNVRDSTGDREIPLGSESAEESYTHRYHRRGYDALLRIRAYLGCHSFVRIIPHVASGLPLLIYTLHILWQCRLLESFYDLAYDQYDWKSKLQKRDPSDALAQAMIRCINAITPYPTDPLDASLPIDGALQKLLSGQASYNTLTQQDMVNSVVPSIFQHFYQFPYNSSSVPLPYGPYSYFRLLVTLSLTSVLLPLFLAQMIRRYYSTSHHIPWILQTNPPLNVHSHSSTPSFSRELKMCTLTSTLIALLYLHSFHFPQVAIHILPLLPIVITQPLLKVMIPMMTLVLLHRRLYRLDHPSDLGIVILNGIFISSLWEWNIIPFLAFKYWGYWFMSILFIASMLSLKAAIIAPTSNTIESRFLLQRPQISLTLEEQQIYEQDASTMFHSYTHGHRLLVALLSWIDYVAWDEEGRINVGT